MAPRKQMPNGVVPIASSPLPGSPTLLPTSKLPSQLRFPLVVITNLALSALLYSFISEFAAGDLSSVSRSINQWWEVSGLLLAKTLELAVGWWGRYDSMYSDQSVCSSWTHLLLHLTDERLRLRSRLIDFAIPWPTPVPPHYILRYPADNITHLPGD